MAGAALAVLGGDDPLRRLRNLVVACFLAFALMIATGADVAAVLRSYWRAAQAGRRTSTETLLWLASTGLANPRAYPYLRCTLRCVRRPGGARLRCLAIIAFCWLVQFVLNASNNATDAALVAICARRRRCRCVDRRRRRDSGPPS